LTLIQIENVKLELNDPDTGTGGVIVIGEFAGETEDNNKVALKVYV
jgi:hypothetical protein